MNDPYRVLGVSPDASDEEIFEILSESGYSRFPVCGENINDVTGILYAKDYYLDRLSKSANKPLAYLIRPAHFVPETVKCDVLFRDMQESQCHISVVVDEFGAVSGIVTLEDLVEEINKILGDLIADGTVKSIFDDFGEVYVKPE